MVLLTFVDIVRGIWGVVLSIFSSLGNLIEQLFPKGTNIKDFFLGFFSISVILKITIRSVGWSFWQRFKVTIISVWQDFVLWFRRKIRVGLFGSKSETLLNNIYKRQDLEQGVFMYFSPVKKLNDVGVDPMFVKIQNNTKLNVFCTIQRHGTILWQSRIIAGEAIGDIVSPYDLAKFVNKEITSDFIIIDKEDSWKQRLVPYELQPRITIDRLLDTKNYVRTSKHHIATNRRRRWVTYYCLRKVFGANRYEKNKIRHSSCNENWAKNHQNEEKHQGSRLDKMVIPSKRGEILGIEYIDMIHLSCRQENRNKKIEDIFQKKLKELQKDKKIRNVVFVFGIDQGDYYEYAKEYFLDHKIKISNHNDTFGFRSLGLCSIEVNLK